MPNILLVGDAAGSVYALSAAIPATHTVGVVTSPQAALMDAAEGFVPALVVLAATAPMDLTLPEFLSLLAAGPATAQVPVARMVLRGDGPAAPRVEWLTPRIAVAADVAAEALRVYAARASQRYQAIVALRQRMTDLS